MNPVLHNILMHLQPILLFFQFVVSVGFVYLVMSQPGRNEGLGGNITAQTSPNFKGKSSKEDQRKDLTRYMGIGWFAVSILVGIAYSAH